MKTNLRFWSYLVQFSSEWKMFQTEVVEKIKSHILCSATFFENDAVCEIMCKNIVEQGSPQMTIWHMRALYWIPKATNTLRLCNTLALPPQQWLHEWVSVLRYTYIVCLVCTRWFKYDRDWFVCKQAAQVPVIFEPPCILCGVNASCFCSARRRHGANKK